MRLEDIAKRPMYYHRDGTPYSGSDAEATLAWAKDMRRSRRIAETTTWNGLRVSTVWLGLDHSLGFGPPLIFETMIFRGYTGWDPEEYQRRYSTEEQAIAGHARAVRWARWCPLSAITERTRRWIVRLSFNRAHCSH